MANPALAGAGSSPSIRASGASLLAFIIMMAEHFILNDLDGLPGLLAEPPISGLAGGGDPLLAGLVSR